MVSLSNHPSIPFVVSLSNHERIHLLPSPAPKVAAHPDPGQSGLPSLPCSSASPGFPQPRHLLASRTPAHEPAPMASDHGYSSPGSIPHDAHGHDDPDHRCVPCSRNRPRNEKCRGRKPCHMVTLSPSMVRQACRTTRQPRSWFDKLATNGGGQRNVARMQRSAIRGSVISTLSTIEPNSARVRSWFDKLTTNGEIGCRSWFDEHTANGRTHGPTLPPWQGRKLATAIISAGFAYNCDSIGSQASTTTSSLRSRLASGSVL